MSYPQALRKRDYAISRLKAKATDSGERYFVSPNKTITSWVAGRAIKFD